MKVFNSKIEIYLQSDSDIKDITSLVEQEVKKSNVKNGIVNIFSVGSTASITTIEFERGVVADLKRAINRLIPDNIQYDHDLAWHDGNGHSHVQAALLGPSLTVPIKNGNMCLGTWQQIIIINHDVRPRNRRIEITIIGD